MVTDNIPLTSLPFEPVQYCNRYVLFYFLSINCISFRATFAEIRNEDRAGYLFELKEV